MSAFYLSMNYLLLTAFKAQCNYDLLYMFCHQMNCPAAMERIREDKPITIRDDKGNTSRCIAEIVSVSHFCQPH